jgi:uncharacterized protein (TIGR02466 family)
MASEYDLTPGMIWATTLYRCVWQEHAQCAPALIDHLYAVKRSHGQKNIASGIAVTAKSSYGLFESPFDLLDAPIGSLQQLKAFFEDALRLAISHVNGGEVEPQRIQPVIADSWFHITNDGGYHDAHFHSHCSWCGIYYVQAGDSTVGERTGTGNGINRFYSPIPSGGGFNDYGSRYLHNNRLDVVPRDGMLLLFPSYLLHSALPYTGKQDRIVISFNAQAALIETK